MNCRLQITDCRLHPTRRVLDSGCSILDPRCSIPRPPGATLGGRGRGIEYPASRIQYPGGWGNLEFDSAPR
jgi:hypothetical protein